MPMFSRPEPQSFTKFVISVGVFLCVAAFVMPALVLRETGVLTISLHELSGLTSVGRAELLRRQRVERDVARAAPLAGLALLVGGVLLILYGTPGLRRQEQVEQARSSVELDKLRLELRPLNEDERRESLREDVVEDMIASATSPVGPLLVPERPRPTPDPESVVGERVRRAREVEDSVLEHIAILAPVHYELHRNVAVADARSRISLDGLLVSANDIDPDVVIEVKIKLVNTRMPTNPRPGISDAILALNRYRGRLGRPAIAWLIYVVDTAEESRFSDFTQRYAEDLRKDLVVSVVTSDGISGLEFP